MFTSQLTREAGRGLAIGWLDILPDMLYADSTTVLQLAFPFIPAVKDALEIIDFERQVELFRSCFVNPPGVKTHTRFEKEKSQGYVTETLVVALGRGL